MEMTSSIKSDNLKNPGKKVDLELVKRSQTGDVQAFEALFKKYESRIYNFIRQMVRNDNDAADLTQETFIRVYNSLPNLRTPEAFVSWLHRVALNLSRDFAKRPKARTVSLDQSLGENEDDYTLEIPDTSQGPEKKLESEELLQQVQKAISTLSPDHRAVVVMHHLEGMDLDEIAEAMGCSVGTIKSRLSRARDVLKRKLGGYIEV